MSATRARARRIGYELTLRLVQLLAIVLTIVVAVTALEVGYDTGDTMMMHPTWLPRGAGEAVMPTVKTAVPWFTTTMTLLMWALYTGARRAVRREFPREAY